MIGPRVMVVGILALGTSVAGQSPGSKEQVAATYDLEIHMRGLVAFVPDGGVVDKDTSTPRKSVTVLLPRADKLPALIDGKNPKKSGFHPPKEVHPEHHAVLRIKAKYLLGFGGDMPISMPLLGTTYDITLTHGGSGDVTFKDFAGVPPLRGKAGAPAQACQYCGTPGKQVDTLAARLVLGKGETLVAEDPIQKLDKDVPWGWRARFLNGGTWKHEDVSGVKIPRIMQHVTASRVGLSGETRLELSQVGGTKLSVVLKPYGGKIEVDILNLPSRDLFDEEYSGPPVYSIDHSNLYYLLAPDPDRTRYWYPNMLDDFGGKPFCTHLQLAP